MSSSKNTKFVGVMLSEAVEDCFRLQALLESDTKSALMRSVLVQHANDNGWTVEKLVERYALHLYSQWNLRWKDKIDFRAYISQSNINLSTKHKLPARLVKQIISLCEEQHRINLSISK